MAYITITPAPALLSIRAGETYLGETRRALSLAEGSAPPVLYVPREDLAMHLLVKSDRNTTCPHKGLCSYYSVQTATGLLENAVWSYEHPIGEAAAIAGYLAFYPDKVSLT
jgi:uncharacterized protein (DUF427 family)